MTKAQLIKALEPFDDDDHLQMDDHAIGYMPQFKRICGKSQDWMPYYCCLKPGHDGDCYCKNKNVHFQPDEGDES
jgi:hypothetical protein